MGQFTASRALPGEGVGEGSNNSSERPRVGLREGARASQHPLGPCYMQYQEACFVSGLRKVRKSATHDPPWAQLSAVTQRRPISNTHNSDLSSSPEEE